MTDEAARRWLEDRRADLRNLIARATTQDRLDAIYHARRVEFDADLTRHLQQRMTAIKAGVVP